jgi:hypothetical protein
LYFCITAICLKKTRHFAKKLGGMQQSVFDGNACYASICDTALEREGAEFCKSGSGQFRELKK